MILIQAEAKQAGCVPGMTWPSAMLKLSNLPKMLVGTTDVKLQLYCSAYSLFTTSTCVGEVSPRSRMFS